jgi:excisionase family DNA binding protein
VNAGRKSGPDHPGDGLLTPREVAEIFGVSVKTITGWAREGRLAFMLTPGGHRRYRWADVRALIKEPNPEQEQLEEDAVRLYLQGWSVRQVAEKFGYSYGAMRRILGRHTTLRPRFAPPDDESRQGGAE